MSKWIRAVAIGALTLSLVACGKSSEEKAQDRAKSMTEEYNALVNELNSSSSPSSSWTDAQINTYEGKINRLESLYSSLQAANGNNGVMIWGGDNSRFIAQARSRISAARSEKASRASRDQALEQITALEQEGKELIKQFTSAGMVDSSWSEQQLEDYLKLLADLRSNAEKKKAVMDKHQSSVSYSKYREFTDTHAETLKNIEALREIAQGYLTQKRAS